MSYVVKIQSIHQETHNVRRIRFDKPAGYHFVPGQATEAAIHRPAWKKEMRPFTFTGLHDDPYLEFTIKCYDDRPGVTHEIETLAPGDELIIDDPWGAISYKGSGCFFAGGAGITPFLAIFRQLAKENRLAGNKLFFSNQTDADIPCEQELKTMFRENIVFLITNQPETRHLSGYLDQSFIKNHVLDLKQNFYVCGPPKMVTDINNILQGMGAPTEALIFEK